MGCCLSRVPGDDELVALVGRPLPASVRRAALLGRGGLHVMATGFGYNELNWHRVMMMVKEDTGCLRQVIIRRANGELDAYYCMDDGRVRCTPGNGERSFYIH